MMGFTCSVVLVKCRVKVITGLIQKLFKLSVHEMAADRRAFGNQFSPKEGDCLKPILRDPRLPAQIVIVIFSVFSDRIRETGSDLYLDLGSARSNRNRSRL